MSLILGKPSGGQHTHIYEVNGDGRSLCLRAPATFINGQENLSASSCENCKRIWHIMLRTFNVDDVPIVQLDLPIKVRTAKSKKKSAIKGHSNKARSGARPRSKKSKKGA